MEIDDDTQYKLDSNLELFMNNNNRKKVYELVEQGANPSRSLFYAIEKGDYALVSLCAEQGGNVNQEKWGTTALVQAIKSGHEDIANLLLDNRANPKANESEALGTAAIRGYFSLVERMVDLGVNAKEQEELVLRAAVNHSLEKLKQYEDFGLDIHYNGSDLLKHATRDRNGSVETMNYLIEKGQSIENEGIVGNDCLSLAARNGQTNKVEYLLNKGANPNGTRDLLADVILQGHSDTAKALLNAGADPHVNNDNPIYQAAKANQEMLNHMLFELKVPLSEQTRTLFKELTDSEKYGKHAEPFKHAVKQIEKRDLNERLQQKYQRPPTKAKSKGMSLKI